MSRRAVAFLALIAAGCDANLPGKPNPKDRPIPAERVLAFDALYSRNCAGCHGADGTFGPAPPLNDPLFRALVPAQALEKVLNQGRPGTPMAPFAHGNGGPLTTAQVQVLVHEIKGARYQIVGKGMEREIVEVEQGVSPAWGMVAPAPESVPPYMLPKESGDAARGAKLFARACASCHGDNGAGIPGDGRRLNQINDPVFLSLISDQALRRIIITGRADLKMPNYAEKSGRTRDFQPLTSTEIADLVALLASWRKGTN